MKKFLMLLMFGLVVFSLTSLADACDRTRQRKRKQDGTCKVSQARDLGTCQRDRDRDGECDGTGPAEGNGPGGEDKGPGGGYGPGDGTGNDGEGPQDGTGYGPGDCDELP